MSLRKTIILFVVIGVALPAIVFSFHLFVNRYHREVDLRVNNQLTLYADLLAKSTALLIWNDDTVTAQHVVDTILKNPDVVSVSINTTENKPFISNLFPERNIGNVLSTERKINYRDREIGTLKISVSTSIVAAEVLANYKELAIILGLQLICSLFLIIFLFDRRVLSPLLQMQKSTLKLAEGKLDQPLHWSRNDEIGRFAQCLDKMRENLATLIAERDRLNTSLEQRVEERTESLNAANADLATTLNQLKLSQKELVRKEKLASLGALVAGISHELNTPLGICVTLNSTLMENIARINQEMEMGIKRSSLQEFLSLLNEGSDVLMRNLERASKLVSRFKQLAIDRGNAARREFLLSEVLEQVLFIHKSTPHQTQCGLEVNVDPNESMNSYPGELGQVITSLLENAQVHGLQNTEKKGLIQIYVTSLNSEQIEIVVRDNGIGIASEMINRIFDPFFSTKFGQGSSGLGLYIVYLNVTSILGGTISVSSEVGKGTVFQIVLPKVAPENSDS